MPLESLLELVETLRERIEEHGAALRQNEALTRYALIDPLLRELGWETENPALVIPEFRSAAGAADYALMVDAGQPPALIIEAKKLGETLDDRVALQSLNYCNLIGTPHFALTDGKTWKIYSTFEQAPLADRLIATFSIGETAAAEVCLKALALWRPSIGDGSVSAAESPIARHAPKGAPSDTPHNEPTVSTPPTTGADTNEVASIWTPLSEVNPPPSGNPPHPEEILLPDGDCSNLTAWNSIPIEVTRWLILNGHLSESDCPIQRPGAKTRSILNSVPIHHSGHQFEEPRQVESLHLDVDYNGRTLVDNARIIISHVGQDPSQFKVRLP